MAASKKRRVESAVSNNAPDSNSNSGSEQSDAEEISESEVQVDFEAQTPNDGDFHGIKKLLQQLFLKAHVNVSQLADVLIGQNYICSVLKQCDDDEDMETEEETIDQDVSFGVFSVVNITEKKELECIQHIHKYLLDACKKACSPENFERFQSILENADQHVGLIVSERFINIPAQISLPLYQTLSEEMEKAVNKKKPFKFDHFLMIAKILTDKTKPDSPEGIVYVNAEEELFFEDASFTYDFSVADQQDTGLTGRWSDSDAEWEPKRRVMLLPAEKWQPLLHKLKTEFSQS